MSINKFFFVIKFTVQKLKQIIEINLIICPIKNKQ